MLVFLCNLSIKSPKKENIGAVLAVYHQKNELKELKSIRNWKTYQTFSDAYSESGDKFDKRAHRSCFHYKKYCSEIFLCQAVWSPPV